MSNGLRKARVATSALAFVALGVGSLGLAACGSSTSTSRGSSAPTSSAGRSGSGTTAPGGGGSGTSAATTTAPATTTTVDPGTLPQTPSRPSADDPAFLRDVVGMWQAITSDNPAAGQSFFFPLSAYRQVKAISDPEHDWNTRLIANYAVDIHALHRQLGPGADRATFISIDVPAATTRWITPGVEYNKGSYWRVLNSTITYSVNGARHTMTVASLISWRGRWYVVHLGAIR